MPALQTQEMGIKARAASHLLAAAPAKAKNRFLQNMARLLMDHRKDILAVNEKDLEEARKLDLDTPRLDRLTLTPAIIQDMHEACLHVASMPDPIGAMDRQWQRPNGILVGKMRIPLGVICMIYEARPNVTVDAAILCLKAGNAVILRGGRAAVNSNRYLASLLQQALTEAGLPGDAAQLVQSQDYAIVNELCHMDEYIDVIIPRGGEGLVRAVTEAATMPVLKHYKGVCHAYIDETADSDMAVDIVYNGKVQRPGVCNALECLLVHQDMAESVLPEIGKKLGDAGVEFHACPKSLPLLGEHAKAMTDEDLGMEFHDLVLAVKVVRDMDEAIEHITRYNSNHTDIIVTNNYQHAQSFIRRVDASMVGVNVSTRFNDGGQLGLGAEIGISTSKLHAYGPMGVEELTTTKFVVLGEGQVRE